ncbi:MULTISPECIES: hypothetical protein [unclassified Aeromonas]|uniref:DUF7710 domain-containing protein n=1 Tax=unclassified Aeromonas TaxID=257493 RepID=UPI003528A987
MAFLVWVKFSVYSVQIECRGSVLHTLIGRYNGRIVKESAIWVFHSAGAQFSGGVFSTLELAEAWIRLSTPVWEFIFADDSYTFVANGDLMISIWWWQKWLKC